MEEWRTVKGVPCYQVSSHGRVIGPRGKYLRPNPVNKSGHLRVNLSNVRTALVHRLVLEAFVGPCPDGMQCWHNDGDPTNNRLENLRWETPSNISKGRFLHGASLKGEANPRAKLTEDDVREIRQSKSRHADIAAQYGISKGAVSMIKNRKIWAHVA